MNKGFLLIFLFFMSCTSIKIPEAEKSEMGLLFKNGIGTTEEFKTGKINISNLLTILNISHSDSLENTLIELRKVSKREIGITSFKDGLKNYSTIKGRYIDKKFRIRGKHHVKGVPPLFWIWTTTSTTLTKDSIGNLVIYQRNGGMMLLTILPIFGADGGQVKYTLPSKN